MLIVDVIVVVACHLIVSNMFSHYGLCFQSLHWDVITAMVAHNLINFYVPHNFNRDGPSLSYTLLESHNVVWANKGEQINDCTFATSDLCLHISTQWMKRKIHLRCKTNFWSLIEHISSKSELPMWTITKLLYMSQELNVACNSVIK